MYFILGNLRLNLFIWSQKLLFWEKYYHSMQIKKVMTAYCGDNAFNFTGISRLKEKEVTNTKSQPRVTEFSDTFIPDKSKSQLGAVNQKPNVLEGSVGTMSLQMDFTGDNFFTIDCSPSEVPSDICSRKHKYTLKQKKNTLKGFRSNPFSIQNYQKTTAGGKKPLETSTMRHCEDTGIIDDEIDIIYEKSLSGDFLSLEIGRPNFFRENLLKSKNKYLTTKKNCRTKCEKCNKCRKLKKNKIKGGHRTNKTSICVINSPTTNFCRNFGSTTKSVSNNEVVLEISDDDDDEVQILHDASPAKKSGMDVQSFCSVGDSPSLFQAQKDEFCKLSTEVDKIIVEKYKSAPEEEGEIMDRKSKVSENRSFAVERENVDPENIEGKTSGSVKDISTMSKNIVENSSENLNKYIESTHVEHLEKERTGVKPDILENADGKNIQEKNDVEADCDDEDDSYENISMEIEPVEVSTADKIEVGNEDFVPLSDIKLSDIEYNVEISDYVREKRDQYENKRRWELTEYGHDFFKNENKPFGCIITLLSYNVLAQRLLTDNISLYKGCNEKHLDWIYRWSLLQYEIRSLQPDIMTFQEVQSSHYHTHYLPWFTHLGYKCIFKKRTGDKVDGCAIIFKSNKFSLIEENSVEYHQPYGGRVLDRDNVGIMVKLSPISFYSPFCVATTHLLYNPKRQDVKLAQLALFITELDRICYEREEGGRVIYCPSVITGDFNADPYSAVLEFIRFGKIRYAGLSKNLLSRVNVYGPVFENELLPVPLGISDYCQHTVLEQGRFLEKRRGNLFSLVDKRKFEEKMIKLFHSERNEKQSRQYVASYSDQGNMQSSGVLHQNFNFCSVYKHKLRRLKFDHEVTTKQNKWINVDYIFYSRIYSTSNSHCVEGPLKLLSRYGLLSSEEAEAVGPLPSDICPSDHFPLAAQFFLKTPNC